MDEFDDKEIATLLRLKRHEQPPPGYFENFLHEFHRRQRDELLRQPLWRICLDRTQDFFARLNLSGTGSFSTAAAAVLVCATVISLKIYQQPSAPAFAARETTFSAPVKIDPEWTLASPVSERVFSTKPLRNSSRSAQTHRTSAPPRYVLDSVPVSYETTVRF